MLDRWSTVGGGGGARTVRHRHPSVPAGDCSPRLESATRPGRHRTQSINAERGRSIDFSKEDFPVNFSLVSLPQTLPEGTACTTTATRLWSYAFPIQYFPIHYPLDTTFEYKTASMANKQ